MFRQRLKNAAAVSLLLQHLNFDSIFEKMLEIHSWICYNKMKSFVKGEGQAWIYPALNI